MTRITLSSLIVTALAAAVFLVPASAMSSPKLVGTVGPGYTITLKHGSKKVTKLKAGKYTFVVHDKSSIHNFTVEQEHGGKFEKHVTATPFVGTKTVTITLKKGKWKFYCSNHESQMFGFFTVTS
jgi:plastocyanin